MPQRTVPAAQPGAPTSVMPRTANAQFYQLYFQQPGVAEAEFERDPRITVRNMLYWASGEAAVLIRAAAATGDASAAAGIGMVPRDGGMMRAEAPATLPAWLSEGDIDFYAGEFKRSGFRGGLNYYRNIDRNWELMAAFADVKVTVPALVSMFEPGAMPLSEIERGCHSWCHLFPASVSQLSKS